MLAYEHGGSEDSLVNARHWDEVGDYPCPAEQLRVTGAEVREVHLYVAHLVFIE